MKIALDIETTGKNPLTAEIIEAYFENLESGESFEIHSKVDKWSYEAEKIHGIKLEDTVLYPSKQNAMKSLYLYLKSLPDDTEFIMYANAKTEFGDMYFDCAVIEQQLEWSGYHYRFKNKTSVHTMAKRAYKKGLFKPVVKKETNRISFGQKYVFEAIFGYEPDNQHRAKSDVKALIPIYYELDHSLNASVPINISQLSFL